MVGTPLTIDGRSLTLDSRPIRVEDVFGALAGSPTASFALSVAGREMLKAAAKAGSPTAAFALKVFESVELALEAAEAGSPTAAFALSVEEIVELAFSAVAGTPSARALLGTVKPPPFGPVETLDWTAPGGRWQIPEWWTETIRGLSPPNISGRSWGELTSETDFVSSSALLLYLPEVFRDDPYLRDIFDAVGSEFDRYRAALDMVLAALSVSTAPTWALARWGEEVGLSRAGLPAEEWRKAILSKITELAITRSEVLAKIAEFGSLESNPALAFPTDYAATLTISGVTSSEVERREAIVAESRRRFPAHILLNPVVWVADIPTVPQNLGVVNLDGPPGMARLTWTVPENDGGFVLTYETRYKLSSDSGWTTGPSTQNLTADISPLTHGAKYDFSVRATNSEGRSDWSDAEQLTIDYAEPSAPRNLVLGRLSGGGIRASWRAPRYTGGRTLGKYDVWWKHEDADAWQKAEVSGTIHDIASSGLSSGVWEVQVRATNSEGDGPWAEDTITPYRVPGRVRNLAAAQAAVRTSIDVTWSGPADVGAHSLTGYDLRYKLSTSETWTQVSQTGVNRTIPRLALGKTYDIEVRAKNAIGSGGWSAISFDLATGKPGAPAKPTLIAHSSGTRLDVAWSAPSDIGGSAITGYKVRSRKSGGSWGSATPAGNRLSLAISSLDKNTEYEVQVLATNANGDSPWSATATETTASTAPSVPRSLSATGDAAGTSVEVTWSAPADLGGLTISRYDLRYKLSSAETWQELDVGTATSRTISSLTRGATYNFQVRARNTAGIGDWTDTESETLTTGKPGKPGKPVLTAHSSGTRLDVAWAAPTNDGGSAVTDYKYRYRKSSDSGWTTKTKAGTGRSVSITGLSKNTEYEVQVLATNANGDSPWSATATATTASTKPSVPRSLMVAADSSGTAATASWTAPADLGGLALGGYDLRYKLSTDEDWTEIDVKKVVSHKVSGLTRGATYNFQVRARNADGNSDWTDTESELLEAGKPGAPAKPTLTAHVSGTRLDVAWSAPTNDGGSAITGYKYRYRKSSASRWTTRSTSGRSAAIGSLSKNTEYEVEVLATNAKGDGPWSATATETTESTAPSVPRSLAIVAASSGTSVTASWSAPADTGGLTISRYDLRYKLSSAQNWTELNNGTSRSRTIGSLTRGATYNFQVRARNTKGISGWTDTVSETLATGLPGAPGKPVLVAASSGTSFSASWSAPANDGGSTITGYKFRYEKSSAVTWIDRTTTGRSVNVGSLDKNTEYQFQVRATNTNGDGPWSALATVTTASTKPGVPRSLAVAGATPTSAKATWSAPSDTGGVSISGYDLRYKLSTSNSWTVLDVGNVTTRTVAGLTRGATYNFQVRARNSEGDGSYTGTKSVTLATGLPGAPGKPTLAPASSGTSMVASWSAPSDNGGSAITGYKVRYKKSSVDDWTERSPSGTGTRYLITGLDKNTEYEVEVAAVNTNGTGPWSGTATATTEATVPGEPTGLTVTPVGTTLRVSWTAPSDTGGVALTGYDLRYKLSTSNSWTTVSVSGTSRNISGRSKGKKYDVQVQAKNSEGVSGYTGTKSATIATTKPGVPTGLTLAVGSDGTSIDASWTAPSDNGGTAITAYDLQYRIKVDSGAANAWTEVTSSGMGTSYSITELARASTYEVQVRATNARGDGSWSGTEEASTPSVFVLALGSPPFQRSVFLSGTDPNYTSGAIEVELSTRARSSNPWSSWRFSSNIDVSRLATVGLYRFNLRGQQVRARYRRMSGSEDWTVTNVVTF